MVRLLPHHQPGGGGGHLSGEHAEELAQVTLQDHAMLMDFFRKGDARGAEYAMAIHMRHAMDEMELEE